MPLSLTRTTVSGRLPAMRSELSIDTDRVRRSRLLTPIRVPPQSTARRASSSVCTSTSGSMWSERDTPMRVVKSLDGRIRTINRSESAPSTRLSYTWYSSRMKSFRSTGTATDLLA